MSRWLTEVGSPITPHAIGRHAKHIGVVAVYRRPTSPDLLEAIVESVSEDIAAGIVRPSIREGIQAVKALDTRMARNQDRDLLARIALAMTRPRIRIIDPEVEAIEAEYRPLLTPGEQ